MVREPGYSLRKVEKQYRGECGRQSLIEKTFRLMPSIGGAYLQITSGRAHIALECLSPNELGG